MKKLIVLFLTLSLALTACAVSTSTDATTASVSTEADSASTDQSSAVTVSTTPLAVSYADEDLLPAAGVDAVTITLSGDSITVNGAGATVNGSTVTITTPGIYNLIGILNNGQVIVDTDQEGTVNIVLTA